MANPDANEIRMLKSRIRTIPDYPKAGVSFKDITPLLSDKKAFETAINLLAKSAPKGADAIAGIESRGFIIGSALAYKLKLGFVPIRKKGKLPYQTISIDYSLEYGTASIEMHKDALSKDQNVIIVDDLLATGGTARAAANLVENLGAKISTYLFLVELSDLKGREALNGYNVVSLLKY